MTDQTFIGNLLRFAPEGRLPLLTALIGSGDDFAATMLSVLNAVRSAGVIAGLNARGIPTARGAGKWLLGFDQVHHARPARDHRNASPVPCCPN